MNDRWLLRLGVALIVAGVILFLFATFCMSARADDELRALTAALEAKAGKPKPPAGPRDGDCCKATDGGADWTYTEGYGWWRWKAAPAIEAPPVYYQSRTFRPFGSGAGCGPRGG